MRDPLFLAQKSTDATEADQQVITDLLDTLRANLDHCVGMAANMIGVKKNIIVVAAGPFQFAMVNPVITKKTGAFIIKVSTTGMLVPLKADLRFPRTEGIFLSFPPRGLVRFPPSGQACP